MEKMGAVMRTERKGSRALCFEGNERASGSYGPETEMPRWPALSSPFLSHPLPAAENASLWVPARSFPDSRAHYAHLVLGALELPKDRDNVCFSASCVLTAGQHPGTEKFLVAICWIQD